MVSYINEFEQIIITGDFESHVDGLVKGSNEELYCMILYELNSCSEEIPGSVRKNLELLLKNNIDRKIYEQLYLLIELKEYGMKSVSQERKEEILRDIFNLFFKKEYSLNAKSDVQRICDENHPHIHIHELQLLHKNTSNFDIRKLDPLSLIQQLYSYSQDNNVETQNIARRIYFPLVINQINFACLSNAFLQFLLDNLIYTIPIYELNDEQMKNLADFVIGKKEVEGNIKYLLSQMTYQQVQFLLKRTFETHSKKKYKLKIILLATLLVKLFKSKLTEFSSESPISKLKVYFDMLLFCNNEKYFSSSQALLNCKLLLDGYLMYSILNVQKRMNRYDLILFKSYLGCVKERNKINLNENVVKIFREHCSIFREISQSSEDELVRGVCEHFFLYGGASVSEFKDLVREEILNEIYTKALLYLGTIKDEETIATLIGSNININPQVKGNYIEVIKSKQITICPHNKGKFQVGETIELEVDIKNIQTLFVKVYEIRTVNYYYNNNKHISSEFSLEGLIPSFEEVYSYADSLTRLVRRKFTFDKITPKRGLYVIEFLGSGLVSRANVTIGALNTIAKITPSGKVFYILNENQEICADDTSGIFFNNVFYPVNKNTGEIVIPFSACPQSGQAVVVSEELAELMDIEIPTENYTLTASFIFNQESVMTSNMCRIAIRPFLYLNKTLVANSLIYSSKVIVNYSIMENEAEVKLSEVYDNFEKSSWINKDIEILFKIPDKLTRIEMIYEADVQINRSNTVKLTAREEHMIDHISENQRCAQIYLRKKANPVAYVIGVYGKNGEGRSGLSVNISFESLFENDVILPYTETFVTNLQGEINLGDVSSYAGSITVNMYYNDMPYSKKFNLREEVMINYPSEIFLCEGETITLPAMSSNILNYKLIKVFENCIIEDISLKSIHINHLSNQNENRGRERLQLTILALPRGEYELRIKDIHMVIYIHCIHGKRLQNAENMIYDYQEQLVKESTEHMLYNVNNPPVIIEQCHVGKDFVKIKIAKRKYLNNVRLHFFASQFIFSDAFAFANGAMNNLKNGQKQTTFPFTIYNNEYLSNKSLDEEIQYVYDRKNHEKLIGNHLQKPSLLLKRKFVQDTKTTEEKLNAGTGFADKQVYKQDDRKVKEVYRSVNNIRPKFGISTFHNFLEHSPLVMYNITPNDDGIFLIENINIECYSHIEFMIIDDYNVYCEIIPLDLHNDIQKIDLRLKETFDMEKTFAEKRKMDIVSYKEKENVLINNTISKQLTLIDSLEKIIYFHCTANLSIQRDWKSLYSFMLTFDSLSEDEKLKCLDTSFSNEFNVFLYFRHREFFNKNVRDLIQFKFEKEFIDWYLLNDMKKIIEICDDIVQLSKLDAFETCLLIHAISISGEKSLKHTTEGLLAKLRNEAEGVRLDEREMKRMFNLLLNVKTEECEKIKDTEKEKERDSSDVDWGMKQFDKGFLQEKKLKGKLHYKKKPKAKEKEEREVCDANSFDRQLSIHRQKSIADNNIASRSMSNDSYCQDVLINLSPHISQALPNRTQSQAIGTSKEYSETHYLSTSKIPSNPFWLDFAIHLASGELNDFLSANIIYSCASAKELLFMISVLGFPVKHVNHIYNRLENNTFEIIPLSNLIVCSKEINEAEFKCDENILINQMIDKDKGTFVENCIYCHETIVTNISLAELLVELLIQIPKNAIPAMQSDYTRIVSVKLGKYDSKCVKTYFYFPTEGIFEQYPPSASVEGKVVARGKEIVYHVRSANNGMTIGGNEKDTCLDVTSQYKAKETENILKTLEADYPFIQKPKPDDQFKFKLEFEISLMNLLKEKELFLKAIQILKSKGVYDDKIWAHGFLHKDESTISEFLKSKPEIVQLLGPYYRSTLITIDSNHLMTHLDYFPLINSRAHRLMTNSIENKNLRNTYQSFIIYLLRFISNRVSFPDIPGRCYLRLCNYLILLERIEEALWVFKRIDFNEVLLDGGLRLQYDYLFCYLFFFKYDEVDESSVKNVRGICEKYRDFPLLNWRNLFKEVEDSLSVCEITSTDSEHRQEDVSKLLPKFSFQINNNQFLEILYMNIPYIDISFYLIDIEVLFSRNPFIQLRTEVFSYVKPNWSTRISLLPDIKDLDQSSVKEHIMKFDIPKDFLTQNFMIEIITHDGKKHFEPFFSSLLKTSINEATGEIIIMDQNNRPIPKVYVKVFAQYLYEEAKFYKDGYSDIRGRFNFISLNNSMLGNIEKFAILMIHEVYGSLIKLCNPPQKSG